MKKIELLAPAGNFKKMQYAFAYGADAIYCGIPDFSLRVRINQFDMKSLKQAVEYAHERQKKVYVTVNIFAHERHFLKLEKYIKKLKDIGPDALIASDPGVISVIKKIWPEVEIHLSTQANCTNGEACKFWAKNGIKRIILGREVTLSEINEMRKTAPKVDLEYFIHGAMCMSYSGRCLLSKYFTDKSANLGDCTQPCRWEYNTYLEEVKRPGNLMKIEEDEHGSYIMNSKDLCLVEYIPELIESRVVSLKIEGRAKSIYYLANTVKVYREAIDEYYESKKARKQESEKARKRESEKVRKRESEKARKQESEKVRKQESEKARKLLEELNKTQNRGFTSGFVFGKEKCEQMIEKSHGKVDWEFCGEVLESVERKGKIFVRGRVHNQIFVEDKIEFLVPFDKNLEYKVVKMFSESFEEVEEAHGGQKTEVFFEVNKKLPEMTIIRRKKKEEKK